MPKLYLLDIEGTTSPIRFVYEVLFPYARSRMREFVSRAASEGSLESDLRLVREENQRDRSAGIDAPQIFDQDEKIPSGAGSRIQASVAYLLWLMDRDRKSTALKSIQGKIWVAGYRSGDLISEVFPDVPPALRRWHGDSKIASYSSGSVEAQKYFFAHTNAGDLTPYLAGYFDTRTGPKTDSGSYSLIVADFDIPPRDALFVSDSVAELDAARNAGVETALCIRPGNPPIGEHANHWSIRSFEEI
ncbi:MAG TPA: acireductone synthase [Terriglobales bacterium]|nr:acireductone synthase [Terriglobales bacterium]